ncbi:uncharacterized protein FIBRA_03686 [Fibroporia radiculosa]|uniref:C2H2-type domain-containing protein n=1 Tax=Fibroporia radiculosa TaxID=599839 RepID=J4GNM0_9APHY|nr:uncharacterized protein FIBRA_03686 [Fibroporia radiculosa]CCM01625.1 predicted protein [Fibroporia radiculosa]
MSEQPFASYFAAPLSFPSQKDDGLAAFSLDDIDYSKQSLDFLHFGTGTNGILAPHPDQFESELDSSLAAFDAELSLLPIETGTSDIFNFLRSDTPTCGPPSSFTVSSESVSGYDSGYADSLSAYSESFYNLQAQSPTPNYPASNYSYTQELDMDFKRLGLPTAAEDHKAYPTMPSSPSIRSSPGNIPNIAHYSPQTSFSSPRGSFSDYEPAQPQQVRLSSSAASDYYPQAQVAQVSKAFNYSVGTMGQSTVAPANVSSQVPAVPSVPGITSNHPQAAVARRIPEEMQLDPKKKYQCPSCPRAFARAYNLKTHIQTHDPNRSKPYACHHKNCGRSFSRKHDLTRHLVSIHRTDSVSATSSGSARSIGVDKGPRGWCDSCGKGWVGKEEGCDCDDVK